VRTQCQSAENKQLRDTYEWLEKGKWLSRLAVQNMEMSAAIRTGDRSSAATRRDRQKRAGGEMISS
jgi:hypothetical protein